MCRICGRMVRCIFDTMPSRTISQPSRRFVSSTCRKTAQIPSTQCKALVASQVQSSLLSKQRPPVTMRLPLRSQLHTSTSRKATVEPSIPTPKETAAVLPPSVLFSMGATSTATTTTTTQVPVAQEITPSKPLVLSKSLQQQLPLLVAQRPHYITAHIHSFPYLLTEGDTLRLPFRMHGVSVGDVLRFNRATIIGSRDFTLKAGNSSPQHTSPPHVRGEPFTNKRRTGEPNYIDERLFECRMRVMGLDSTPMMTMEKKKRRIRRTKTVTSKHKYTVLKVMEVRLKGLDELTSMQDEQVVLE